MLIRLCNHFENIQIGSQTAKRCHSINTLDTHCAFSHSCLQILISYIYTINICHYFLYFSMTSAIFSRFPFTVNPPLQIFVVAKCVNTVSTSQHDLFEERETDDNSHEKRNSIRVSMAQFHCWNHTVSKYLQLRVKFPLYIVSALCDYIWSKSISTLLITVMGFGLWLPLLWLCW